MNGKENNDKAKRKMIMLSKDRFIFLVGDFGSLILYLGFWGLDLEIWSKKHMRKKTKGRKTTLPTGG